MQFIQSHAEKKNYETLLVKNPLNVIYHYFLKRKKWSDRYKIISSPLFASYIFVKIDLQQDSLRVLQEPNSVQFVQYMGKPAPIEDEVIEMIQIFLDEYPDKIKIEQEAKLRKGNVLEIKKGPFAGRKVKIEKVKNQYYVVVQLPMLNRTVLMEVRKEDLAL